MQLPSPGFLFSAFVSACRQFPGPMLCAFLGVIACFGLIDPHQYPEENHFYTRNWLVCQLGLPFLAAVATFAASRQWAEGRSWLAQAFGIVLLVGIWFWFDPEADHFHRQIVPQYMVLLLVAHLAVAIAPFANQRSVRDFWEYNRQLFSNFVVGSAFTLILFAGLALALLAIDNLFNLDLDDRIYPKLFVVLAGLFNTTYFLYHFPAVLPVSPDTEKTEGAYSWMFRILCKYILIPIVILYFVILYAYGAKIGIHWSLPKGWVSSLVIGFSVAGIFTYLLNFYLPEEDNSLVVKGFKRWFWWVLMPLTLLLFIAIGKRISDYGVTESRYLVVQLGVWLMCACLYFSLSKKDNIKFIPISLGLFALSWAFGPLSAFSVSKRSQKGILTTILERNGRFENGKLKPGTAMLTEPEREKVSAALIYLEERKSIADLLPTPVDSVWFEHGSLMRWLNIGVPSKSLPKRLNLHADEPSQSFSVAGYDMAYHVSLEKGIGTPFRLSSNGVMLEWHREEDGKDILVDVFSLQPTIQKWAKKMPANTGYGYEELTEKENIFTLSGRKGDLRIIVELVTIDLTDSTKTLDDFKAWILLKETKSTN